MFKRINLLSHSHVSTTVWLHYLDFNEIPWEEARLELCEDAAFCFEQILKAASHKTVATSHHGNHPRRPEKLIPAGEVRMNSYGTFSDGLLHKDTPLLGDF